MFFWVLVAVVVIATVYEYSPATGGLLLLVVVFGMLKVANDKGTIQFSQV